MVTVLALSSCVIAGLTSIACGAEAMDDEDEPVGTAESEIVAGTATSLRPEVGFLAGRCTATLVHPRWIATAASCFNTQSGAVNDSFQMHSSPGVTLETRTVTHVRGLSSTAGAKNIAFGRLSTPSTVAPATMATSYIPIGQTASVFGYGCLARPNVGPELKRYLNFPFGTAQSAGCSRDLGGPRFNGAHDAGGALWGVTGPADAGGLDTVGDLVNTAQPYVRAINALGGTTLVTSGAVHSAFSSPHPSARALSGDFNGDGNGDIAIVGHSLTSIPIAYGNGAGGFGTLTNLAVPNYNTWARQARSVIAGDFDGDGDSDIALVGGSGWTVVRYAFSNGNGTFTLADIAADALTAWAVEPGAYAVAVDASGDGISDIALLGGQGWTTVPILKRKSGGVQELINAPATFFALMSQQGQVRGFAGRFSTGTQQSLILVGHADGSYLPIATLAADGATIVHTTASFPEANAWAREPESKVAVADFNGDGRSDVFVSPGFSAGGPDMRFMLSSGTSAPPTFSPAYLPLPSFNAWSQFSFFVIPVRRAGTSRSSIALVGSVDTPGTVPVAHVQP